MTFNSPPRDMPDVAQKEDAKVEFSRRLQRMLMDKGWNQSELARRVQPFLPENVRIGRDMISNYIRGLHIPRPEQLEGLAKALGVEPTDLVPPYGIARDRPAPLYSMVSSGPGTVWLKINQEVSTDTAMEIVRKIHDSDTERSHAPNQPGGKKTGRDG
jgi:transcriptional regulator with XRE-family HTH domain